MYKIPKYYKSKIKRKDITEGEPIEWKIARIVNNGEPIKDGAPKIFTERKDGVRPEHNIKTDRWEIATDAMTAVAKTIQAKRQAKAEGPKKEAKIVDMKPKKENKGDGGAESTTGTNESK